MGLVENAREEFRLAALKIPEVAELKVYTQEFGQLSSLELLRDTDYDHAELDIFVSLPLLVRLWRRSCALSNLEDLLEDTIRVVFESDTDARKAPVVAVDAETRALIHWLCMRRSQNHIARLTQYSLGTTTGAAGRQWSSKMHKVSIAEIEPDYPLEQPHLPGNVVEADHHASNALFTQCVAHILAGTTEHSPLERILKQSGDVWPLALIDTLASTQKQLPVHAGEAIFEDVLHAVFANGCHEHASYLIPYEGLSILMDNLNVNPGKVEFIKHLRHVINNAVLLEPAEKQFYGILAGDFAAACDCQPTGAAADWEVMLLIALIAVARDAQTGLSQNRVSTTHREMSQIIMDQRVDRVGFGQLVANLMAVIVEAADPRQTAVLESLTLLLINLPGGPEMAFCEFVESLVRNVQSFSNPLVACVGLEAALLWLEMETEARDDYVNRKGAIDLAAMDDVASPFTWVSSTRVTSATSAALRRYIELCVEHRNPEPSATWALRAVRLISSADPQVQRKLIAEVLSSEIRGCALDPEGASMKTRNVIYEAAAECPKSALAAWSLVKDGLVERVNEMCRELQKAEAAVMDGKRYASETLTHDETVLLHREITLYVHVTGTLCLDQIMPPDEPNVPQPSEAARLLHMRAMLIEMTSSVLLSLMALNYFYFTRLTDTAPDADYDHATAIWGVSTRETNCIFWRGIERVCTIPRRTFTVNDGPFLIEVSQNVFDTLVGPAANIITNVDYRQTQLVPHGRKLVGLLPEENVQDILETALNTDKEWVFCSLESLDGFMFDGKFISLLGFRNWCYAEIMNKLVRRIGKIGMALCANSGWDMKLLQSNADDVLDDILENLTKLRYGQPEQPGTFTNDPAFAFLRQAVKMELQRLVRAFVRFVEPHSVDYVVGVVASLESAFDEMLGPC